MSEDTKNDSVEEQNGATQAPSEQIQRPVAKPPFITNADVQAQPEEETPLLKAPPFTKIHKEVPASESDAQNSFQPPTPDIEGGQHAPIEFKQNAANNAVANEVPPETPAQPLKEQATTKQGDKEVSKKTPPSTKRAFKTREEKEIARDKVVQIMSEMPEGSELNITKIMQDCSCSKGPAESLYNQALKVVKKLIFLNTDGCDSTRIPDPKVTSKGLSVVSSYIDYLFADSPGDHPYQNGVSINCVREGNELRISPKN